jgi:hypothetical protein
MTKKKKELKAALHELQKFPSLAPKPSLLVAHKARTDTSLLLQAIKNINDEQVYSYHC